MRIYLVLLILVGLVIEIGGGNPLGLWLGGILCQLFDMQDDFRRWNRRP